MTGHIRRRGERSWQLKFDVGTNPLTGKRITRFHSFKGTKRDAEKELTRLLASVADGNYVDPSRLTVSEFFDRWERDWAATNVSPKTFERYQEIACAHIRPRIGALRIQKLKAVHLAELYALLLREGRRLSDNTRSGLSGRTVGHVHRVLHRALGHAVRWGLIVANPAASVEAPRVAPGEVEVLTEEQVQGLFKKLKGRSMYLMAAVGLATGVRRGELLALRWKDVDLDAGKLQIERSLEQTKAGLRFKEPKTRHGRRRIALPVSVVAELRAHWRRQQEQRLALGLGKDHDDALVFRRLDGSPLVPNSLTTEWRRLVGKLNLPRVTLHAWRHTHASQLIRLGLDVLTISRRLGHGSPSITLNVYGHLFKGSDDRAAEQIDAAFSRAMTE